MKTMNRRDPLFRRSRQGENQRYATERAFENDYNGWLTETHFPQFQIQVDNIIKLAQLLAYRIKKGGKTSGLLDDSTNLVADWIGSTPKRNGAIDHGILQWSVGVDLTLVPPTLLIKTVPAPGM